MSAVAAHSELPGAGELFGPASDTYRALGQLARRLEAAYAQTLERRVLPLDANGFLVQAEPYYTMGNPADWDVDFTRDANGREVVVNVSRPSNTRVQWPRMREHGATDTSRAVTAQTQVGHIWRTPKLASSSAPRVSAHDERPWDAPSRPTRTAFDDPSDWLND